jgi:hypothetical protein
MSAGPVCSSTINHRPNIAVKRSWFKSIMTHHEANKMTISGDYFLFFETHGDYIVYKDHRLRRFALIEHSEEGILVD